MNMLTNTLKFRVLLNDTSLAEEGDERLIGRLDQHELQRITIESNSLEGTEDSMKEGATSNFVVSLGTDTNEIDHSLHLLLPIPLISSSPKIPFSWKLAK